MALSRLSDQVGRVVSGRYRIVAPLGSGTFAQVFLATDVHLRRQVALKMLHPSLADDPAFASGLLAEAQVAARLSHPNIVAVHDWGEDDGPYLVTEYLAGGSLAAMIATGRRLSPAQALTVGLDVSRGLAHAHKQGIVHRDVKPANILFDEEGRARIADFGLARLLAQVADTQPEGTVLGTVRYNAPEQVRGERAGPPADVYSLTLSLVEAVIGTLPFSTETVAASLMARVEDDVPMPDELGALGTSLERAGRRRAEERIGADELGISLLATAERLAAPDPLPLVGALEAAEVTAGDHDRTDLVALPLDVGGPQPVTTDPVAGSPATGGSATPAGAPDEPADGSRRRRLVIALTLVVALVVGAVFLVSRAGTDTHTVPALAGLTDDNIDLLAERNGWTVDRKKARQDGTEPGEILSTDPVAGEELEEGGVLTVIVSDGNELTELPEGLVGQERAAAEAALVAVGLVADVATRYDEVVAAGHVIEVLTEGLPEQIAKGDEVPLVVSDGPEPRVVPAFDPFAGYEAAAGALREIGLVAEQKAEFNDEFPRGVVLESIPAPGAEVPRGATIVLRVSRGPDTVTVPDVRGRTLAEAKTVLEAEGLVLGQQCCRADGTVAATDPPPGTVVRRGTQVAVFLTE